MKIGIYNNGIPFHGKSPIDGPLGGSESGLVYVARELAALGHSVQVYCNCPAPDVYDNVQYCHFHSFFDEFRGNPWDVFVSLRSFDPFLLGRIAPRTIFWTGDAVGQPVLRNLPHEAIQNHIDLHFCVSEWHRRTFLDTLGLAGDRVIATRNGFSEELAAPKTGRRQWTNGVYSSTPFRGLKGLLEMFPRIRERTPEMSLDVFSSMKVYGWSDEKDRETFGALYREAVQPGVTLHGSVGQAKLMERLSVSGLLLYPNTFDETSCIAAIEAQASGAVVVTSAKAALMETVENGETGFLIPGDPASPAYQRAFVEAVTGLASNRDLHRTMSDAARARAFREYSWRSVAVEWAEIFQEMVPRPVPPRWSGPLAMLEKGHAYLDKGSRSAVKKILESLAAQPFFDKEVRLLEQRLLNSGGSARRPPATIPLPPGQGNDAELSECGVRSWTSE